MNMKRFLAALMVLALVFTWLPVGAVQAEEVSADVLTEEDYVSADLVFDQIDAVLDAPAKKDASQTEKTDAAIAVVTASEDYVEGSLERSGNSFTWWTTDGVHCVYNPRMRKIQKEQTPENAVNEIVNEPVAVKGGTPSGNQVYLIGPYYGSDENFTNQYKNEARRVASAIGDTDGYTLYSGTAATVDKVAEAVSNGAVVFFDSHGTTDYENPDDEYDFITGATNSYLCLTSTTGLTDADYDDGALYFSDGICINGATIANHMTKQSPNGILWMAICLGMGTDTMYKPLREMGVGVVYGYSESVTFAGEYLYEETFWGEMIEGKTVAQSIATMKSTWGNWDWSVTMAKYYGYYDGYATIDDARNDYIAFPVVVSDEDTWPGQRSSSSYGADSLQTVNSTYSLGEVYEVTDPTDPAVILEEAYALGAGEELPYTPTLTGTVTEITTAYNATYGNITVIMTVAGCEDKPIKCYRLQGDGADQIAVGDTITVTGTVVNYQHSSGDTEVEFTAGCQLLSWVDNTTESETPETPDTPVTPSGEGIILDFTDVTNRISFSTTQQVWQQNGITLTNDKAASSSNVADYSNPARFYKNSSITVSAADMAKLVFTCTSSSYATALSNSVSVAGATVSVSGSEVTIELSAAADTFTIADLSGGQVRVSKLTVYTASQPESEGNAFTMSASTLQLDRGDTLTLTVNASFSEAATEYNFLLDYNKDVFELVSGVCDVSGATCSFTDDILTFSFDQATAYSGAVGTVVLQVREDAVFGEYTIAGVPFVENDGTELTVEDCTVTVTLACVHNYESVVTAPTVTEQGFTTHTCTGCGDTYVDSYTKPLGNTYTVSFVVPAGVDAIASMPCNSSGITLPEAGVPAAYSNYTFAGWSVTSVAETTEIPEMLSGMYYATADVTLYPVYTYSTGSGSSGNFHLVTDASALQADMEVIIAAKDSDYALSTTQNSNNRAATAITKTDNSVTYGDAVAVLQLQTGTAANSFAFYDPANTGYLYAASSSKNYLRTQASIDGNASWSITVSSDGTATIVAQGSNSRSTIQYNNNSSSSLLFSCYSSASQKAVCLYARSAGTSYYSSLNAGAAAAENVAVGENTYATVTEALEDTSADYIVLLEDVDDDLYITSDVTIDLNGCILTADIQIEEGATLYLFDSATADYTADRRGGIIGAIEGNLATVMNTPASYGHNYKYLTIQEEDGLYSAHRIYLAVKSVTLVPYAEDGATRVSYKTVFKCSDLVASYVDAYGAQLTGETTVNSAYDIELAAGTNEATAWLTNSLSVNNSDEINAVNALLAPSVSAYIRLGDEIIASASVSMSIQDLIVAASANTELTNVQKTALGYLYHLFQPILDAWSDVDITNIKIYGAYWK